MRPRPPNGRSRNICRFYRHGEHILDHGYYGAAAALAGGVLEQGLIDVAERHNVPVGARGDLAGLNARLGQVGVYNALRQKEVHYFIGVRTRQHMGSSLISPRMTLGSWFQAFRSYLQRTASN